jgi:hypothetical protein
MRYCVCSCLPVTANTCCLWLHVNTQGGYLVATRTLLDHVGSQVRIVNRYTLLGILTTTYGRHVRVVAFASRSDANAPACLAFEGVFSQCHIEHLPLLLEWLSPVIRVAQHPLHSPARCSSTHGRLRPRLEFSLRSLPKFPRGAGGGGCICGGSGGTAAHARHCGGDARHSGVQGRAAHCAHTLPLTGQSTLHCRLTLMLVRTCQLKSIYAYA